MLECVCSWVIMSHLWLYCVIMCYICSQCVMMCYDVIYLFIIKQSQTFLPNQSHTVCVCVCVCVRACVCACVCVSLSVLFIDTWKPLSRQTARERQRKMKRGAWGCKDAKRSWHPCKQARQPLNLSSPPAAFSILSFSLISHILLFWQCLYFTSLL